MSVPTIDLITPEQRRRLKLLRVVALVAAALVGAGVVFAFTAHWAFGLVALFLWAPVVHLVVVLFETIVPGD
ncbi:MAG: hypothetical protein ACR2QE_14775 [Acidimicrobiales bacterium]